MEKCDLIYEVSFDPLYRYSQFYTLITSFFSIFPLIYLVYFKLRRSTFNENIKFLYMLYFSQILISVLNNVIVFFHHVLIPFIAVSKCDLLVVPMKNRIFQSIGVFGISCPMLTILGISVERLLALIFARCYEHVRLHIGVLIGFIAILIDVIIIFLFFRNERFDQPSISYFMVPDTSGFKMNILCWTLLSANALNLIFNYFLIKVNTVLKEKWRNNSLSTRFQMEENIITTKFSTFISFLHVFFFSLYLAFTLFIRLLGPNFLTTQAELMSVRGVYITIPTYNLIIGVASCVMLRHLRAMKVAKVHAEVTIKYSGLEGSRNHDEAIFNVWKAQSATFK
uniref:Serpentine Receptor, class V n=1 Tax=Caenorhabditis tropicalis TaxID=1561998 RepID=A0A1I7TA98_9PELO